MRINLSRYFLLLVCALVVACNRSASLDPATTTVSPNGLATTEIWLARTTGVVRLNVEIARTADQHAKGLQERASLPADAGMLFWYEGSQSATAGFWMLRTYIPLDIAFVDAAGVIRSIQRMDPCQHEAPCPSYEAGVEFQMALEVNRGWFDKHGIRVGDRLLVKEGGDVGSGVR